jgi:hypothetical protein
MEATEKRIQLVKDHYKNRPKAETAQGAKIYGKKWGNWVCLVDDKAQKNFKPFYTIVSFPQKWVSLGNVFGIWNELTLIEKLK